MFTFFYTVVATTGTYSGKGMARSPKAARAMAVNQAWDRLAEGDRKAKYCSGIAVEWVSVFKSGKLIFNGETY